MHLRDEIGGKAHSTPIRSRKHSISDLINIDQTKELFEKFFAATGFALGFREYPSNEILVGIGFKDICSKFHRACPESSQRCQKSNLRLIKQIKRPGEFNVSQCLNGLVDGAIPVIIAGEPLAYLLTGQVLFEKPNLVRFKQQARRFGYDTEGYLEALARVPIVSEEQFQRIIAFLGEMAFMIAEQGFKNLQIKKTNLYLRQEMASRKALEAALLESGERFKDVAANAQVWVWEVDPEGKYTYASPVVEKLLGYQPREVLGKHFYDFFYPSEREELKQAAFAVFAAKQPFREFINRNLHKNGEIVWLSTSGTPVLDAKGNLLGYRGADKDITERIRAHEALRSAEEKYRSIFENAVEGIFQSTPEGRHLSANPAMARMFGYDSPEELIATVTDIKTQVYVDPNRRDEFQRLMEEDGYVRDFEYRAYRKKGDEFLISENARAVRNEKGDLLYYEGFMQDITERREAMTLSENLISESLVGVYLLQDKKFILTNHWFHATTGYTAEELFGMDCRQMVHPEDRASVRANALKMFSGERVTPYEYRAIRKTGEIRWIMETVSSIRYLGKRATLGFWLDITASKEAEAEIRRLASFPQLSPTPILEADITGVITFTNPALIATLEKLGGEVAPRDFLPGDMKEILAAAREQQGGHIYREVRIKEALFSEYIYFAEPYNVLRFYMRDITDSRRAEEALRQSEERYHTLFENMLEGVATCKMLFDERGRPVDWVYLDVNSAFERLTGLKDVAGKRVTELIPEIKKLSPEVFEIYGRVSLTGQPERFEIYFKPLEIWLHITAYSPAREHFVAVFDNITERKLAEVALRESEERYRTVANYTFDMEYWIAHDGKILYMSPSCERLTGYPPQAYLDDPQLLLNIVHPDDRKVFSQHHHEVFGSHKERDHSLNGNYNLDFRLVHRNGKVSWVNHNCLPVFGNDGRSMGRRASNRDITQRIKAEEALAQKDVKIREYLGKTVAALANTLGTRDPYTAYHQERVTQLACAIGKELKLSEDYIEGLRVTGFLHDIGKIAVPSEILNRPGKITDYEFAIIKTHPQVGYDILREVEFPWPVALTILQHHERLNGSGYPNGLSGHDILHEAKILAVADVVEAMSFHRPYRPALGIEKAFEEISRNKGLLYDPEVVEACLRVFTKRRFKFNSPSES